MRLINSPLKREFLERESGFQTFHSGAIPIVKKKHYRIIRGTTVAGDAPKELLKIYFYKKGQKRIQNPWLWDTYIAKTGHKWYPYESITEYLLNQLGICLGLDMAESNLVQINGQIRFLSKVFLQDGKEQLEHGAELYAGYLGDKDFVHEIEKQQMARDFFTLSFTYDTLKHIYPHQADDLFLNFVRMLVFDAIVGNNDRHYYNWGVITDTYGNEQPRFSPIYDTARALFWNLGENSVRDFFKDENRLRQRVSSYVSKSSPKIGVEKKVNITHIEMISKLMGTSFSGTRDVVQSLIHEGNKVKCLAFINTSLHHLLSPERCQLITECLKLRFETLIDVTQKYD